MPKQDGVEKPMGQNDEVAVGAPNGEAPAADSDFESYVQEVRNCTFFQDVFQDEKVEGRRHRRRKYVPGSYRWNLEFYRKQAPRARLLFRTFGLLSILLSIALPIVAAFGAPLPHQALWLSVMAAAIALLTSLNAFYHWDQSWHGFMGAQLELERLRDRWEIDIARAKTDPCPAQRLNLARAATEQFVERAREVIESETKGYFAHVKFPEERNQGAT